VLCRLIMGTRYVLTAFLPHRLRSPASTILYFGSDALTLCLLHKQECKQAFSNANKWTHNPERYYVFRIAHSTSSLQTTRNLLPNHTSIAESHILTFLNSATLEVNFYTIHPEDGPTHLLLQRYQTLSTLQPHRSRRKVQSLH